MSDLIKNMRQFARPVIFSTGIKEAPYSIAGTAFIVAYNKRVFVISAAHVIGDCNLSNVFLSPTARLKDSFHWKRHWKLEKNNYDSDSSDLIIIEAKINHIHKAVRAKSHVLNLKKGIDTWFDDRNHSLFFTFGYPIEKNFADYEKDLIDMSQFVLHGSYTSPSIGDNCYEVSLKNPLELSNFNGLSGSPVFSVKHEIAFGSHPKFCGMVIRGTASSGKIHFLSSDVIIEALNATFR